MDQYNSDRLTSFAFGVVVILSVAALLTSLKAGQLMEWNNILDSIHKLQLDKIKLKTSHKVCLLYKVLGQTIYNPANIIKQAHPCIKREYGYKL